MTCATISERSAIGSISTPRDTPQLGLGQLYETDRIRFGDMKGMAVTSLMVTVVNDCLQYGQMLMSASGSGWGSHFQSYRLAGFTFHASTPQLLDDRALVGRGVGVGADTTEPHPLTHSMHGIDLTADADDVDDNS